MGTILILLTLTFKAYCPEHLCLYIEKAEGINHYEPLIKAITRYESFNGVYVWNAKEEAVGWFQIRPCRVDAYNKATGSHYILTDFYDYNLSRKMFLFYAHGKSYEQASKDWNGSGKMTIDYWKHIKTLL